MFTGYIAMQKSIPKMPSLSCKEHGFSQFKQKIIISEYVG